MEISGVNTALSALSASEPSTLGNAVSMKMLDKALDMSETMNDGLRKMMELSVNPSVGSNFDMSV
ncbi:MAG: YjfB family protein [Muribaculaceae bacterium]|nr:YjfB family protein [Roseburia sp.]MCM1431844.1 YjfB family protein [Muribaculaceae bacterium]MCM1493525.1 YjfB family protein [Muribaculaceae bacterium]